MRMSGVQLTQEAPFQRLLTRAALNVGDLAPASGLHSCGREAWEVDLDNVFAQTIRGFWLWVHTRGSAPLHGLVAQWQSRRLIGV